MAASTTASMAAERALACRSFSSRSSVPRSIASQATRPMPVIAHRPLSRRHPQPNHVSIKALLKKIRVDNDCQGVVVSSSEWNPSVCRFSPCSLHRKTADQACQRKDSGCKGIIFVSNADVWCKRWWGCRPHRRFFWQIRKDLSFALAFETIRERNSALMVAQRFAFGCNIILAGPADKTAW